VSQRWGKNAARPTRGSVAKVKNGVLGTKPAIELAMLSEWLAPIPVQEFARTHLQRSPFARPGAAYPGATATLLTPHVAA
jgi:hypothetical protein